MKRFDYLSLAAAISNSGILTLIVSKIYKICFPKDTIPDYSFRVRVLYYPIGAGLLMIVALIGLCVVIAIDEIEWLLSHKAVVLSVFLLLHIVVFWICRIGNVRVAKLKNISIEKCSNKRNDSDKASIFFMLIIYVFVNFLILILLLDKMVFQIEGQNIGISYYVRMISICFFAYVVLLGLTTWIYSFDKQINKYNKVKVILSNGEELESPFSEMKRTKEMLIFEKADPVDALIQEKKYLKIEIPLSRVQRIVYESGE